MPLDAQALPGLPAQFCREGYLAELVCQGGLSDQKIKKGTFVRVEKLSF